MLGLVVAGRNMARSNRVRVFVDGEEVTHRCFAFDDRQGWAGLFTGERVSAEWVPTHGRVVAREVRTGRVVAWVERKDGRYMRARKNQEN